MYLSEQVVQKYPQIMIGFALVTGISDYANEAERKAAEEHIISATIGKFPTEDAATSHYLNHCYTDFYASMGLKPKKVSTPIKQACRILKNRQYRSIHQVIDICMLIEYTTLVSFQVYDADKIKGDIRYEFSDGKEVIQDFHFEEHQCNPGELILVDDESVLHCVSQGNNVKRSIDKATTKYIIRIMGVPEIKKADFDDAVDHLVRVTSPRNIIVLTADRNSTSEI